MLDELLDIFDRDDNDGNQRRDRNAPRQRGIRGFLSRLFGDDDDTDDRDRRYDERPGYDRTPGDDRDGYGRDHRDARRRNRDDDDGFLDFGD